MKSTVTAIFISLFAAVSCIKDDPDPEFELKVGDMIPEFTVTMSDGTTMTSDRLSEGPAIIMFFNTGCPDCQNTLPSVQKIYDEYKDQVSLALISREQSEEEIKDYWQEKGYTMPFSAQPDRKIYNLFATSRVPRVYICNDGKIVNIYTDDPIPAYDDMITDIMSIFYVEEFI
mgnify:CR=1 FL=1